jgi:tetratricopeptide (TPR) repeat protein
MAHLNLGCILESQQKYEEAKNNYEQVILIDPK